MIKLDVGAAETDGIVGCDSETGANCGCSGVDILFVVDNSGSMAPYQTALSAAFPAFSDAIIEALPAGVNVHVGVTSTEMGFSRTGSSDEMLCTASDSFGQPSEQFYATPDVDPSTTNGAQGRLFSALGREFFSFDTDAPASEIADLEAWFSAAAQIGESGSNIEMLTAAAGWATSPVNVDTNDGFIRDGGTVLALFFVQDELDQTPNDATQDILDMILAAKTDCGGMDCVIAGGFIHEECQSSTPIGQLMNSVSSAPVIESLPPSDQVSAETFIPALRDTLADAIVDTCIRIPPAG